MIDINKMLNLQLFAGEGAGDGAGEGSADAGVNTQEAAVPAPRRAKRENPMANVKYGIQPEEHAGQAAAGTTEAAEQQPSARDAFLQRVGKGGEDEQYFSEAVSQIVQKRLGDTKKLESSHAQLQQLARLVASRYNVNIPEGADIDVNAIMSAVDDDDRYWEEREVAEGVPKELLKREDRVHREQQLLNQQRQQAEAQERARMQYSRHLQEAAALKAEIPDFDLDQELANPVFANMARMGFPLKNAYYAVHHEDIMRQKQQQMNVYAQQAAQQARQMTANAIAAGASRPEENGSGAAAGAIHITDPSQMTKDQRAELRRRVMNGEKISW